MDNKNVSWYTDLWSIIVKNLGWIYLVTVGLIGKFSYDFLRNKKFTLGYIIANSGISIVGGWIGAQLIDKYSPTNANILVPIATMLSYNFVSALMSIDWKAFVQRDWKAAFDILMKKKD